MLPMYTASTQVYVRNAAHCARGDASLQEHLLLNPKRQLKHLIGITENSSCDELANR